MTPYNCASLIFAFCTFFTGLLIWMKRADSVGMRYFIFTIFTSVWASGFSIMISEGTSYEKALFWARVGHTAAYLIPVTWFHFTLTYVQRVKQYRFWLGAIYAVSLIAMCFGPTKWGIYTVAPAETFKYYYRGGAACTVFVSLFCVLVPVGFYELYKKSKMSSKDESYQAKGFIAAALLGFVGGGLGIPLMYDVMFPQYNLFLMPFYPFIVAYFMIKKNLFNEHELAYAAHRDKLAAMGTLAASINHEIKNPLFVIKNLAETYLNNLDAFNDKSIRSKVKEVLQRTIVQSEKAMNIMRNFSSFAKKDISQDPEITRVSLKDLLEHILPLIQHEMDLEKIHFQTEISVDAECVYADAQHLEEIIFNLFVNACQAMKDGGKLILKSAKTQNGIEIVIEDSGPGMSEDKIKRIFEPFYTTKEQGTGLGLYITRQLVERNNGTIRVTSSLGQGTKFILNFGFDKNNSCEPKL